MRKLMKQFISVMLFFVIIACGVPPAQPTLIMPTAIALPEKTTIPTPHPLAINVQNASQIKLQKTIGAGTVNDVVWSPNGDVIAIAQDFDILFYNSSSLQLIDGIDLWGNQIAFSPDGLFLEPVCKIRKEKKGCNGYHSGEISSPLLVTSSNPSELLKAIDKPLNKIALAVM